MNDWTLLNEFERRLLAKLLTGDHPVLATLRSQLDVCQVKSREFTGHGFFVDLHVDRHRSSALTVDHRFTIGGVDAEVNGLPYGAGFMVFVDGGYLEVLEGFSYDGPWPSEITNYSLMYSGPRERDPGAISTEVPHT